MSFNDLKIDYKYIIVNEKDKQFGLYVNTVGFQSIKPNSLYPLTNHPTGYYFNTKKGRILREYQFVYITKGGGTLSIDHSEEHAISKGVLFVLYPGQWHTYQPFFETGWNEYYIGFEGKIIEEIVANLFLSTENQIFEVGLNEELVNLFVQSIEIAAKDKKSSQQYLSGIVLHMLGLVLSVSQNRIFEKDNSVQNMEKAKIIMKENIDRNIDLEELAAKLNMGYTSFRKIFKEYTGFPPAKYFNELKINKAKQQLVGTSLSVKEILNSLGFNSYENFFLIFKKSTGYTPVEYRDYCRNTKFEG